MDERTTTIVLTNGTNTYTSGTNFGISSGSMNLEEILCDSELTFGSFCSNKFEVECFNLNQDVTGYDITVTVVSGTGQSAITYNLFKGKVDSSTKDNYNIYRKIVAYDSVYYKKDTDIASYYNAYFAQTGVTFTLGGLRNYLCTQLGISYTSRNDLVNENLVITASTISSMKFSDILSMICELQCCFPNCGRDGYLKFVTLATNYSDVGTNYEEGKVEFEDYSTNLITGIKIYASSNELTQTYPVASAGANAYSISGNIFLLSMNATEITAACTPILNAISSITYNPCKLPLIVSDLSYLLGAKLKTSTRYHYIMGQTLSGSQLVDQEISCVAYGKNLNEEAKSYNNDIATGQKMSSIEQSIDNITLVVSDLNEGVTALEQTTSGLTISVTQMSEDVSDLQNGSAKSVQTTEGFTFDNNGLTITNTGSSVSTNIDEEGMTVSDATNTLLEAKNNGVSAYRLQANGYLQVGTYSRLTDYTTNLTNYTGCFWVGEE